MPDPGGDWAVRVPKPGWTPAVESLEREVRLLPALEALGLPSPCGAFAARDDEGRLIATVHRVLEGAPLRRRHARTPGNAHLSQEIGRFFARLHAFPRARALGFGIPDIDLWADQYAPLVEACLPLLPARSREWVRARARRFVDEGGTDDAPHLLVHADVSGSHILLDGDGRLAGVIDFADAVVADPALDFAGLLYDCSWAFLERVIARYEDETGRPVDPDLRRRVRFYIDVAPLFGVRYGAEAGDPETERADRRKFAARAAAATRAQRA